MSVIGISLSWWYWAAVNYRVLLQLPERSQLSFSASLSAKLAVLQLFMKECWLFLPANVCCPVWKWNCMLHWSFGFEFESDHILSLQWLVHLLLVTKHCTSSEDAYTCKLFPSNVRHLECKYLRQVFQVSLQNTHCGEACALLSCFPPSEVTTTMQ